MARISLPTGISALAIALIAMSTSTQAAHQYPFAEMVPVVEQLRCSIDRFEELACRQHISRYDRHRIRRLSQTICQLAETVATTNSLGRVKAELYLVSQNVRLVDRRTCSMRGFHDGPRMQRAWDRVKCDLDAVQATLLGCGTGGVVAPPPIPDEVGSYPPRHPRGDLWGARQGNRHQDVYADWRHQDVDFNDRIGRAGGGRGTPPRSRPTEPPWLAALLSALAR